VDTVRATLVEVVAVRGEQEPQASTLTAGIPETDEVWPREN
jgi:hypothetical protein